ncbi:CHRD domain-containing protein [Hymenobacter cellulosilyticus]|uniref:CHRD domain-containing protein n=1 Tax=Hymenobacter cellulosilyticus TaxID=2932248 RepID=A0A8T9Q4H2_9BACT|nr:CHRD domain-containing protein [Hymenobacter cellulosilyticus]UOQ70379.1 CHRD domain-containing protein [Hymenobacter cellulosilyticus]
MQKHVTLILTGLLLLTSGLLRADHLRAHLLLSAKLEGAQEVPAVNTTAKGVASFTMSPTQDTLFITASFVGLSGPITGAHVHLGARGVAGPIVTSLVPMLRGNRLQGFLTGADFDVAKRRKYLLGAYYINVHTAANPNGEIRGQIELEKDFAYITQMTGAAAVPAVTTTASGFGGFALSQDRSKIKFQTIVRGLSGAITGAELRNATATTAGTSVLNLLPFRDPFNPNVFSGEFTPTAAVLAAFEAGTLYVNITTAANAGGEIRGRIFQDRAFINFDARLDSAQVVGGRNSFAKGIAILRLSPTLDSMYVFATYAGLSGPVTSALLYTSPAGQPNTPAVQASNELSGFIQNDFLGVLFTGLNTNASPLGRSMLLGNVNLQLATAARPNGEIRGQVYRLAREGYTFAMAGNQERPTPVASPGYGSGLVSIDRDQSNAHFMLSWGGLTGPAQAGHFHTGLITQAGPVVFDLMPFFDNATAPMAADGYWQATANAAPNASRPFTLRRSIQFRRDSMYVNLHTAQFPAGEIRGQVLRGAKNLSFVLSSSSPIVSGSFAAYPSPFQNSFTLTFDARAAGTATVQVTDLVGRTVLTVPVAMRPGANRTELNAPELRAGVYLVTLEAAGAKTVTRVVKQ